MPVAGPKTKCRGNVYLKDLITTGVNVNTHRDLQYVCSYSLGPTTRESSILLTLAPVNGRYIIIRPTWKMSKLEITTYQNEIKTLFIDKAGTYLAPTLS